MYHRQGVSVVEITTRVCVGVCVRTAVMLTEEARLAKRGRPPETYNISDEKLLEMLRPHTYECGWSVTHQRIPPP